MTPEARELGEALIAENSHTYIIDDAELERVKKSYPCIWKDASATPKLCFVGCPHLSAAQLEQWTDQVQQELKNSGRTKVAIPTVFTAAPAVADAFRRTPRAKVLADMGILLSSICPLMYMNNPLCGKMPVITNSNKLRTYSTARYYTDAEILAFLTKGGDRA